MAEDNSNVSAYLYGVEGPQHGSPIGLLLALTYHIDSGEGSSSASAYLRGKSEANSEVEAFLAGQVETNDTVSAFLKGISAEVSSSPAYLRGKDSSFDQVSAYLKGKGEVESTVSAFLEGWSPDVTDSAPAFLKGKSEAESSTSAYLEGVLVSTPANSSVSAYLRGILRSSVSAFLSGNIAVSSSASAYIAGPREAVISSRQVYLTGILRSSVPAYINGQVVKVDYIWLKADDLSIAKKFRVLQQDYDGGTEEKAETVNKTISGGIDISIGESYTTWNMIIRVGAEATGSFGTLEDLEALYSLNNPNGTPSSTIIFVDHRGYEYRVKMIGNMKKNLSGSAVEGNTALYFYRLELIKAL